MNDAYLHLYIRDHLAASTGGLELCERICHENQGNELGRFMEGLVGQLKEEREIIRNILESLHASESFVKDAVFWLGEKITRLKFNRKLTAYSPLSRVYELETLIAGVHAKLELWDSMLQIAPSDPRLVSIDFARLKDRAITLIMKLEDFHTQASKVAFLEENEKQAGL